VQNHKKIISGPGEYEISGVSILGMSTFHDDKKGAERGKNTVFVIEIDQFRIAHLGDLGHNLTEAQLGELGEIDILMIPVGGVYTIDAGLAAELAKKIDPIAILPMHFADPALGDSFKDLEPVDEFIKNLGMQAENLPKLVVKEPLAWENEQQHVYILDRK
jgi:L-ascorbate metabolism protein UlaG (beta-lactamase superfamily)